MQEFDISVFSSPVQHYLLASGWSHNRHVDVQQIVSELRKFGYVSHELSISAYKALSGLRILGAGRLGVSFADPIFIGRSMPQSSIKLPIAIRERLMPLGSTPSYLFLSADCSVHLIDAIGYPVNFFATFSRALDVLLGVAHINQFEIHCNL